MTTQAPSRNDVRAAWEAVAPGFDDFVSPHTLAFGAEVVRAVGVGPGTRFLDVAAGSGALTIPAARLGAATTAVDIAPTMIRRLVDRAAAEGLTQVEGLVADGTALDLPDDAFDVAASLNGISVFPDLDAGLAELVRVTRPGGRVVVVAFGGMPRVEFVRFLFAALQAAIPGFDPPFAKAPPLPFQLADPDRVRTRLVDAGLTEVQVETTTWPMTFRSGRQYWEAVTSSNPIAARLAGGLSDRQRDDAVQVLDGMLRERSGGRPGTVLHNEMNVGTGVKPARA